MDMFQTHEIRECLTKEELVRLNSKAIKRGYSRCLKEEMLAALPDTFAPSGMPLRINFSVKYDNDSNLGPDCLRLVLWLPADPTSRDERGIPTGITPAWLDVKKGEMRSTSIWVSKEQEEAK